MSTAAAGGRLATSGTPPLDGLRVLDLSRLLPGPYATLVLADLGATVLKIEDPDSGDPTRHSPPLVGDVSAYFLALNRNKRSVALDLKTAAGADALRALARDADVLIESFRPGVMDRLGLGDAALRALNPRLIYCALSGYGQNGPDRLKAGHDLGYIARAGVLGYGGPAGGAPVPPGVQVADIGGALFGVIGVLAALEERRRTGLGRFVDVALCDAATAFLHMHLGARLALGGEGRPLSRGTEPLNGGFPCYGVYRAADGKHLAVAALEPKFFLKLADALGDPDLAIGAWDGGADGAKTREKLTALFASRPRADWLALLGPLDVCVEPIHEGDEALADPQLLARGLVERTADGQHLRTPLNLGRPDVTPAPALGADPAQWPPRR